MADTNAAAARLKADAAMPGCVMQNLDSLFPGCSPMRTEIEAYLMFVAIRTAGLSTGQGGS